MTPDAELDFVYARAAAGVLLLDDLGRVLLVVPSYKDHFELPGGFVEPGETPRAAAVRELREELAIRPAVGRLLVADWWPESSDGFGGAKVLFVFDGGHLTAAERDAIRVDGHEVIGYAFHARDELATVTVPRLANRIEHALAARHEGSTRYLEDGELGDVPLPLPAPVD